MKGSASTCCAAVILLGALAAPASAQNPGTVGAWSAVQNYPVVPVSAGVMPDGKIVAWDQANAAPWFGPVPHNGPAMVLTPGSGAVTRSSNEAPNTLFCSLLTSLPDGRLAVIGGGSDSGGGASSKVQVYDEDSRTFSVIGQMERARWYPGGSIDAQGNPIVAGGTSTGIERIDASTGTGTLLNTSFPAHWYADLIRTPDNRFAIEDVGDLQGGENSSRFMLNGTSLSSSSDTTLLKNRYRGIRTMIGPHKMLWSSGGTSRESMIIDASGGTPTYSAAASSAFPHMTGQGVTLPTGDVLAVGGNSSGSSSIGTPVMTPELYKPASNTWSSMANMSRQRQYHSVAALLPDGRVWSAGTSWEGTQEANGQYFSPPYLYTSSGQPASRPTATDAPSSVKAGDSFSIATSNPSQIRSASIVRLASTTHQLNAGQAYVPLSTSVSPNGGRVQMTAPTGAQAPPGYYMVFLIDSNGVPSVAPIVRLRSGDSTALPVRAVQSSQTPNEAPAEQLKKKKAAARPRIARTSRSNFPGKDEVHFAGPLQSKWSYRPRRRRCSPSHRVEQLVPTLATGSVGTAAEVELFERSPASKAARRLAFPTGRSRSSSSSANSNATYSDNRIAKTPIHGSAADKRDRLHLKNEAGVCEKAPAGSGELAG